MRKRKIIILGVEENQIAQITRGIGRMLILRETGHPRQYPQLMGSNYGQFEKIHNSGV